MTEGHKTAVRSAPNQDRRNEAVYRGIPRNCKPRAGVNWPLSHPRAAILPLQEIGQFYCKINALPDLAGHFRLDVGRPPHVIERLEQRFQARRH